jgi:hypothetical protein
MKISPLVYGGLALALASVGCAHKDLVTPDATPAAVNTAVPTPEDTPVAKAEAPRPHYLVRKGDTLWSISAKSGVLGDPFRWPLIFKQNRDQIQDPDIIEIDQSLDYAAPMDRDAVNDAIQKAKDTPPFAPHDGPRKQLPLNY